MPFQKYTPVRAAQSAVYMKGKLFQTKGKITFMSGTSRNNRFSASFSCASHSRALKEGMVNIHIDHILQQIRAHVFGMCMPLLNAPLVQALH